MKKLLAIAIFFLFIGMSIVTTTGNTIFVDTTTSRGVTISFNPSEPNGENNWYVTSVTVYFYADNGTIIESIYIRIDGSSWQSIPNNFEIGFEGEHTYDFLVVDSEENEYPFGPYEIKIDTVSPWVDLTYEICGNIFTGKYILLTATCQDSGGDETSGISHVEFYMNETLQKVDDTPPYTWILRWPYPPPISFFKVIAYDNAGNSEPDEFSYTMPQKMHIIGFIRNPEISEGFLKFHADFVITFNYYGIIINKNIIIELFDYDGVIKDRFINAKIWAFWIPFPKK